MRIEATLTAPASGAVFPLKFIFFDEDCLMANKHESKKTTDVEEIRRWAEERDGHPAVVAGTNDSPETGILRIDFGDHEESLEEISWEEFETKFKANELAFLYQEETADGGQSRFFKFVNK